MPTALAILGIVEIAAGLLVLGLAPSIMEEIAAILLIGFAVLTFGFAAVVYELQRLQRSMKQQQRESGQFI